MSYALGSRIKELRTNRKLVKNKWRMFWDIKAKILTYRKWSNRHFFRYD